MSGKRPKRRRNWRILAWRLPLLYGLSALCLSTLVYSVYGQRQLRLVVGEASPESYFATQDTDVVDALATERERQIARSQVGTLYSADAEVERLVVNGIINSDLPESVKEYLIEVYNASDGISEEELRLVIPEALGRTPLEGRSEVRSFLDRRLLPTSRVDPKLTNAAQEAAGAAVDPIKVRLEAGELIVEEGEILTQENLEVLQEVGLYNPRSDLLTRQALIVLGCLLLGALLAVPLIYARSYLRHKWSFNQLAFVIVVTLLSLLLQRLLIPVDNAFIVAAIVPLLLSSLVTVNLAIIWGLWLAALVALLVPATPLLTLITAAVGVITSCFYTHAFQNRSTVLFAGALGGITAVISSAVLYLVFGGFGSLAMWTAMLWLLAGGVLAGLISMGLLPLAETGFGFLSEFRLLELSSPSHPLLQRLSLEAPGTYQHSLIISNLVEKAVDNIGGDALLARVAALYHDVGKMKRAQFFVENQMGGENPHDNISPHLSYLIITSHVRDGIDLLREHKLPKALDPFVMEHHGTTVLSYFYKRALEDDEPVDELNFRYAGPRPRSKETAVLMIADAVESASRTLKDPSQGSIRALIDQIIEVRLQDKQLAESPLNFHDLEVIANTFERMLTAVLHSRIRYPSATEVENLKRGRSSRRNQAVSPSSGS